MLFREREREIITLNGLLNCGIKQCKYKTCLAIFISICPLSLSAQTKSNISLCSSVFLCTRHRAKLRREVTPPMKIIKALIKSLYMFYTCVQNYMRIESFFNFFFFF